MRGVNIFFLIFFAKRPFVETFISIPLNGNRSIKTFLICNFRTKKTVDVKML